MSWRRRGSDRRRGLGVERLEGRRLLSATYATFPLASRYAQPGQIVDGPDGNLWFTDVESIYRDGTSIKVGAIGRINPTTGAIVEHPLGVNDSAPNGLLFTTDGNIWFADPGNHGVGLYNPVTGYLIEFAMPLSGGTPEQVAEGPDGNIWFTDDGAGAVGEISPTTHVVHEFALPTPDARPEGIAYGPGGDLWFAESNAHNIASIDPTTHAIAEYSSTVTGARVANSPTSLVDAPGGVLGFIGDIQAGPGVIEAIYTFDATTHAVAEVGSLGDGLSAGRGIATGPLGPLWSEYAQADPSTGGFDADPGPPAPVSTPTYGGIVEGPDGNLWSVRTGQVVEAVPVPLDWAYVGGTVARDPIVGGGGLAGQAVYLDLNHDGVLDQGDISAVTDASGAFLLGPVAPTATVTLRIVPYPGNAVLSAGGAIQTIAVAGGRVAQATFDVAPFGSTLPLTYNPAPFGSQNPDVQTAEVDGLYHLILGRAPDPAGGAASIAALKGGTPLVQVAAGLLHSTEYFRDLAASDYRSFLGREASPAEVDAVATALQGGLGVEPLAGGLLTSAEFNALHPTDAGFVQAVYAEVLGRSASASELSAVEGLLAGGTGRAAVVGSVLGSSEADGLLVGGLYGIFLGRAGDAAGVAHWLAALQAGADPLALAADFASSPEFVALAGATVG